MLNAPLVEKIVVLNPLSVEISIYGSTEVVHGSVTNVPGSFKKTIKNLELLKNSGVTVIFKGFLHRDNFHQRWQIVELAKRLGGLYSVDFNLIPMLNGDLNNLSVGLSIDQIKAIYKEVENKGLVLRNNVKIISRETQLPKGGSVVCQPARINGCVASDGIVYLCPILRVPMGDIREKDFETIWRTEKVDSIRNMKLGDLKSCSQCSILEYCDRCPGIAYIETGNYLGPAPRTVCSKYKALSRV